MKNVKPISVPLVATVSAALQGGLAVLFVPVLSFFFLTTNGPAPMGGLTAEQFMTGAVLAPFLCGALGFVTGALMAYFFNLFAKPEAKPRRSQEERARVQAASVGDAA